MKYRSNSFRGTCLRACCPRDILLAMYESEDGGFFHIEQDGVRVASSAHYEICSNEFDILVNSIRLDKRFSQPNFPNSIP